MASEFLELLKAGKFAVPVCQVCGKKAWPPAPHCPLCLAETKLEPAKPDGVLEEFATSHILGHEGTFGVVRMDGVRLIGTLDGPLHKGAKVRMIGCGVRPDGSPFYNFAPAK